jgi:hypothetical protein
MEPIKAIDVLRSIQSHLYGISAHKIKDINVLAAEYVKKINFIRGAV